MSLSKAIGNLSKFQEMGEGVQVSAIEPNLIEVLPQIRTEFPDAYIEELAESIADKGQIEPGVVRPNPQRGGKPYLLVVGECRWRAVQRKGLLFEAKILELDELEARWMQRAENNHRLPLSDLEIAKALSADCDLIKDREKVAKEWGKSVIWISQRLQFLEAVQDEGSITKAFYNQGLTADITAVTAMARLEKEDKGLAEQAMAEVKQIVKAGGKSSTSIRKVVKDKIQEAKGNKGRAGGDAYSALTKALSSSTSGECKEALSGLGDDIREELFSNLKIHYEKGKSTDKTKVAIEVLSSQRSGIYSGKGLSSIYQCAFLYGALGLKFDRVAIVFASRTVN